MKVLFINGPNLNLLGTREPHIYGYETLNDVEFRCKALAERHQIDVEFQQSNFEGQLIEWIHQAIFDGTDAIIINAGAYTHTSIAIHDALKAYKGYKIELHISNPHLRESFRHVSYLSLAVDSVVAGLGVSGYEQALDILVEVLN